MINQKANDIQLPTAKIQPKRRLLESVAKCPF